MSHRYQCEHCCKLFKSKDARHHHLSKYHGYAPIAYNCKKCSKSFRYYDNYVVHLSESHKITNMRFECGLCASSFKHGHHLAQHMKLVHDPDRKTYKCPECDKIFSRRDSYSQHMKQVHAQSLTVHRCELCERMYRSKAALKLHVNMNHNENFKRSACPLCPSDFKWPHHLKQHISKVHIQMNVQTQQKSHTNRCELCLAAFDDKFDLLMHMRTQHNLEVDIYKCCQCKAVFNLKEPLLKHLEVHQEQKSEHKCSQCHPVLDPKLYIENTEELSEDPELGPADEIEDFEVVIMEDQELREMIKLKLRHKTSDLSFESEYYEVMVPIDLESDEHADNSVHQYYIEENNNPFIPMVQIEDDANLLLNESLMDEENRTDSINQFSCSKCNAYFATSELLSTHNTEAHHESQSPHGEARAMDQEKSSKEIKSKELDESYKNMTKRLVIQLQRVDVSKLPKVTSSESENLRKEHKCKICSDVFENLSLLKRHHRDVHLRNQIYKCEICDVIFLSKVRMDKHMDTHEANTPKELQAPQVNKENNIVIEKTKFRKRTKVTKCKKCNVAFKTNVEVARHVRTYHMRSQKKVNSLMKQQSKYKCKKCPKVFVKLHQLSIHYRALHSRGNVRSSKKLNPSNDVQSSSSNITKEPPDLDTTNMNTASTTNTIEPTPNSGPSEDTYECGKCVLYFTSKLDLLRHISEKHMNIKNVNSKKYDAFKSDNTFTCGLCGSNYPKKSTLAKHIMSKHPPDRSHRCIACSLNFEGDNELNQHLKMQHRHKCGICSFAFVRKEKLMGHMMTQHAGRVREHNCDTCNVVFRLEASLAKHMDENHWNSDSSVINENEPQLVTKAIEKVMHKCGHCNALFPLRESLQRHIQLEHDVGSVHKCGDCTAVFNDIEEFKEHLQIEHIMQI